jgi:hypothetical protein
MTKVKILDKIAVILMMVVLIILPINVDTLPHS